MEERILNCKCSLELIFNIREELDKSNAFNKAYLLNLFNKKYNCQDIKQRLSSWLSSSI